MNITNLPGFISSSFFTLDSLQANIFIADYELVLVYMNPMARKTLKSIENDIFKVFSIRVEDFIGGSIQRFHKDPLHVAGIIRNSSALPHEVIIDIGKIHLKFCINGITTRAGEIFGYIVNWEDVSEKTEMDEKMRNLNEELIIIEKFLC